ncbi:MAG: pantoate--beta-alanine ligase [Epsilonproteobacteria bacterium]|nr:pantoate--beta-alanine ligase [Campylobacterota bacterium]
MKIINDPIQLQQYLKEQNKTIGFVPTMGALHEGHRTLIQNAREQNELVVVSIFVNPTQFLEGEDFDKYPRKDDADKKICELSGVDVLFFPNAQNLYFEDEVKIEAPDVRGYVLEGNTRAGHFSGVLRVVMKLLNIVRPTRAYFGKKDAQQLNLIQQMVKHYFLDIEIVPVDTVRDANGLALSSRNAYLSDKQRQEALKISASLYEAARMIARGENDTAQIKTKMVEILKPLEIGYVAIVNRDFNPVTVAQVGDTIVLVEVVCGTTRLLDNIWL